MQLSIARSPAELDSLRSRWEHLYCSERHTVFQTFAWNRLAAQAFGDRAMPYVIHAENSSGAAIIPAAISGGAITFLGEELFDYRDVLIAGDDEALNTAWHELARLGLPLRITGVRRADPRWQRFDVRPFSQAPYVCSQGQTGEQFAANHKRSARFTRRLGRMGAELKSYAAPEPALVAEIYRRKGEQEIGNNLFRDARRAEFMVAAGALEGWPVEVHTLEAKGAMVGALLTLRDGRTRRFYTTWFDPAWGDNSPGTALLFEVTRESLAEGLDCDYMTGTQSHKLRFATGAVPLFRVEGSPRQLARATTGVAHPREEEGLESVPQFRAA